MRVTHWLWNELSNFNKMSLKGKKCVYQPQSNCCPKRLCEFKVVILYWAHTEITRRALKRLKQGLCVKALKAKTLGVGHSR